MPGHGHKETRLSLSARTLTSQAAPRHRSVPGSVRHPALGRHRLPSRLTGKRRRGTFAFTPEDLRHHGPSSGRAST